LLLSSAASAPAATRYVWQSSPGPAPPYTDWATAAHTIQEAIDTAIEGDTVLVTDFANTTGDGVFDGTLKQALAVKLEESPFLSVAGEQLVQETLRFMNRPADAPLTRDVARDVCQRQGIKALINGAIAPLGNTYVVTLTAEACSTGDVLPREQVEAPSKEAVLGAVGKAAAALRARLGESLASVQKLDKPIEQATTSSLDALRAFSLGDRERAKGSELDAAALYRRAIELAPDFAMAHARLGTVYGNVGENDRATEHRKRAFALRDRVSDRERFYITAHYYNSVEHDPTKAAEVYELWKRTYPRDSVPYVNLGQIFSGQGDEDRALASYLDAIRVAPMQRLAYENATSIYVMRQKYDEARKLIDKEIAAVGENPQAHMTHFHIAALQGDAAGMDAHAARVRGTMYEGVVLEFRGMMAAQAGRIAEFRRLLDECTALCARLGLLERSRAVASYRVVVEALVGNTALARDLAQAALTQQKPTRDVLVNVGFGLVLSGDVDRGERALRAAAQAPPGLMDAKYGPVQTTAEATVEWRRGRPARAVEILDKLDLMAPKDGRVIGAMLIRGRSLLAVGRAADAEAQFQAILDHRAYAPFDLAMPLAQLGIAEARARAGNVAGARQAYDAFFQMWKDADPDVPLLKSARAASSRLGLGS
jgi:tetratricopeptide (TPR) repeat protein